MFHSVEVLSEGQCKFCASLHHSLCSTAYQHRSSGPFLATLGVEHGVSWGAVVSVGADGEQVWREQQRIHGLKMMKMQHQMLDVPAERVEESEMRDP